MQDVILRVGLQLKIVSQSHVRLRTGGSWFSGPTDVAHSTAHSLVERWSNPFQFVRVVAQDTIQEIEGPSGPIVSENLASHRKDLVSSD